MGDVKSLARTFHRKQVWCIAMHGKSVKLYKKTILEIKLKYSNYNLKYNIIMVCFRLNIMCCSQKIFLFNPQSFANIVFQINTSARKQRMQDTIRISNLQSALHIFSIFICDMNIF